MGISHGPADWKPKKIDVEKNRRAFRRGMCGGALLNKHEKFLGKLFHGPDKSTTTIKDKYKLTEEQEHIYNEYVENVKKNINKNVTDSFNEMMTNIMVDVVTNTDNILNVVASSTNVLTISDAEINGEDVIISAGQSNQQKVEADMTAQTKVINEIKQKVSETLSEKITDQTKDGEKLGEVFGGVVNNAVDKAADVANNYIDKGSEVLNNAISEAGGAFNNTVNQVADVGKAAIDGMFGAGSRTSTNTDTEKELNIKNKSQTDIEKITKDITENINEVNLQNITQTTMDKNLTTETLNECKASVKGINDMQFKNLTVNATRLAKLDLTQQNKVKMVVKCVTNTEIINKMSDEIMKGIETEIANMDLSEGTLEAAGGAIAAAVVGAGEGVSKAAKGTGEGVATAAKGVGEGVNTALGGQQFMLLFIVCAFALVGYYVFKGGGRRGGY